MEKANVNGIELEYSIQGEPEGEWIVLIHGSVFEDMFSPMIANPSLSKYSILHYHRRGYGKSTSNNSASPSINNQSKDCLELMKMLNINRAHVVSHSYAGLIALQTAVDEPTKIQSLTLMEPPLAPFVPAGEEFGNKLMTSGKFYQEGKKSEALDTFLKIVFEGTPNYREVINKKLGNKAFDSAVPKVDTMFQIEYPALLSWKLDPNDIKSLSMPVLSITGTDSAVFFKQVHTLLKSWFSNLETLVVPNASHMLHIQDPLLVANGLNSFFSRHPIQS